MEHPDPAATSDSELLLAFCQYRSESAFAEVVRRHGGVVMSVCRSVLGNAADAEDAAQAVFLTLALKARSASVRARVVPWLHRVAWYVATRAAKARAVRRRHEREATQVRSETLAENDIELTQMDAVHAALERISEKYRTPLILHHLQGRSHAETAAAVGCSTGAVAVRLHRGRDALRKRLERQGIVLSAATLAGAWGFTATAEASAQFAATTSHAATLAAAGKLSAGAAVSGSVMNMSKEAMNMLYWAKLKTVATAVAALLVGGAVVANFVHAGQTRAVAAENPVAVPTKPAAYLAPALVITGVITDIQDGKITIMRRTGAVTVAIDKETAIKVDDKPAEAGALKVGMEAAAFAQDGKPATEIRARSPRPRQLPPAGGSLQAVTGIVSRIDAESITVQRRNVPEVVLPHAAATVVSIDDRPAGLADLKAGMSVGVLFTPDTPAAAIFAFSAESHAPPK